MMDLEGLGGGISRSSLDMRAVDSSFDCTLDDEARMGGGLGTFWPWGWIGVLANTVDYS